MFCWASLVKGLSSFCQGCVFESKSSSAGPCSLSKTFSGGRVTGVGLKPANAPFNDPMLQWLRLHWLAWHCLCHSAANRVYIKRNIRVLEINQNESHFLINMSTHPCIQQKCISRLVMSVIILTLECYDLYWAWTSKRELREFLLQTSTDLHCCQVIISYSLGGAAPEWHSIFRITRCFWEEKDVMI